MRRCIYSKQGCLVLLVSLRERGHLRRAQDLELKGTANEDDGHHGDNDKGHLLSWAHTQVSLLYMHYLRYLVSSGPVYRRY